MPNKETFKIKPIKRVLDQYVKDGKNWIDPFAGNNSPAEITNDINPKTKAAYHLTAAEFVSKFPISSQFKGTIFDPPYSSRQVKECYSEIRLVPHTDDTNSYFYSSIKNSLAPLIMPHGIAICCGWNSVGFGKVLGFELIEILLVCHGASHNDTIVTVEKRINETL